MEGGPKEYHVVTTREEGVVEKIARKLLEVGTFHQYPMATEERTSESEPLDLPDAVALGYRIMDQSDGQNSVGIRRKG